MEGKCLTFGDRIAMVVGKVVIGGAALWVMSSVIRPIVKGLNVTVTIGRPDVKESPDE